LFARPGVLARSPANIPEAFQALGGQLLHPIKSTEAAIEQFTGAPKFTGTYAPPVKHVSEILELGPKIPKIPQQKGTAAQIGAGAVNAASSFVDFFLTPGGAATLGIGSLPKLAQKAVLTEFAAGMAVDAPEQLREGVRLLQEGKVQEGTQHLTSGVGASLLSAKIASHVPERIPAVEPTEFVKPGDIVPGTEPPLIENLRAAKAPATAAVVEQVLPERGLITKQQAEKEFVESELAKRAAADEAEFQRIQKAQEALEERRNRIISGIEKPPQSTVEGVDEVAKRLGKKGDQLFGQAPGVQKELLRYRETLTPENFDARLKAAKATVQRGKEVIDISAEAPVPPSEARPAAVPLSPEGYRVVGEGRFESDTPPPKEAYNVQAITVGGKTTYTFRLPAKELIVAPEANTPEQMAQRAEEALKARAPVPAAEAAPGAEVAPKWRGELQDTIDYLRRTITDKQDLADAIEQVRREIVSRKLPRDGGPGEAPAVSTRPISTAEFVNAEPLQPRADKFSETTASKVETEGFKPQESAKSPPLVWRDPQSGKLYRAGGSSRAEGLRRLGGAAPDTVDVLFSDAPNRQAAFEEAIANNMVSVPENIVDTASAARKSREQGIADEQIAQLRRVSSGDVAALAALDTLPTEIKSDFKPQGKRAGARPPQSEDTALALGRAVDRGILTPDKIIADYLALRKQQGRINPTDIERILDLHEKYQAKINSEKAQGTFELGATREQADMFGKTPAQIREDMGWQKFRDQQFALLRKHRTALNQLSAQKKAVAGLKETGKKVTPAQEQAVLDNAASANEIQGEMKAAEQELLGTKPAEPAAAAEKAKPAELTIPELGLSESQLSLNSLRTLAARDPAQWKALKQYFGANTAAKVAKLAAEKFERMRTAPKVKWTGATEEPPLGGALYGPFGIPSPAATIRAVRDLAKAAGPAVKAAAEAVRETGREAMTAPRMTDYRRSVLNWSAKLQRSFGEAAEAQKEIQKAVPDAVRREGITNWIQANGDPAVLTARRDATTDPKLRAGYDAALKLTPEEIAVANDTKAAFDALGKRGQHYDVLNNFRDNYVTQIWNLKKGPAGGATSRTLKDKFRFSKARTFESYFEGEQAGFTPKTKDIAKLLPVYLHEMNSVIAARQLVEQMSKGKASDGRPLVAPRGRGISVEGPEGKATLIMPKVAKGDRRDYRTLENQPAMSDWVWRSEDSAGNPIFEKADLALHPEAFGRIKAVLGRSAIREWYSTRTTQMAAIPKAVVKAIDLGQSEVKRTMLGFFAPFHQVQEATHAVGHRVNPLFNVPKPDLVNNAAHMDAARHGLMMLPDRVSEGQFMEGFRTSGLVSKIPGIGPMADWYSNYLFKEYIPGLKYKTYEAILTRNQKVYAKELASGEMKSEDVKVLSAEQSNAAYGHLNYADLGRNPTIQHFAQLGALAPDFFEARARFAGQAIKGTTGAKIGREQVVALATLAIAQATTAWIASKLVPNGDWDSKHPFELKVGQRSYTMRSVPEDIAGLFKNWRTFLHSRLSPIIGKGTLQYASGVDYAGRKVSTAQTTKELATAAVPLTLRTLPGIREITGMDRPGSVSPMEQLSGAIGLRISRSYQHEEINTLHDDWMKKQTDPKVKASYEQHLTETPPISLYKGLLSAMADRNEPALREAVADLAKKGRDVKAIKKALDPVIKSGKYEGLPKLLFHDSRDLENKFKNSLTREQRKLYDAAVKARRADWDFFRRFF